MDGDRLARRRRRVAAHQRRPPRDGADRQGLRAPAPPRVRRRRHRADARRARPPRPPRPLARLGPDAPRRRRQHRLLRADRRGGVLRRAVLRHGAARARARAAPLARRPLLVEHLGPAAAALVLPLRRAPRSSPSARAWRCSGSRCAEEVAAHDAAGLHDPAHRDRPGEPRPAAAVALRRRLPRRRLLGRPRRGARAAPARAGPAPGHRPLRRGVRRLAVVQRDAATSWSTRSARTTASSSSSSTRCSTARRSRPARSSGSTRTSRSRAAGSRASRRSSARSG